MASNFCHVPLTLFTTSATVKLFTEDSTLKKITIFDKESKKQRIIDVTEFPKEKDMDIGDWHEAWNRFLSFMLVISEAKVQKRWKDHYEFLSRHDNFKLNFPAILRFDIEERTRYFTSPHTHDLAEYRRRFDELKFQVLQEKLEKEKLSLSEYSHPPRNNRFNPYPREKFRPFTEASDSSIKSFRAPRSDITPICFICGRDHKFSKCEETTTAKGKPAFAKRVDKQLVKRDGGAVICFFFNAYSNKQCDRRHNDLHVCSLCGLANHGACTRKCL